LIDECHRWLASEETRHVVFLHGFAGSGKSTSIKRTAYELANRDFQVFYLKARDGIDVDSATEYLQVVADQILIAADSLAETTEEVSLLLKHLPNSKRILTLSAERHYRLNYIRDTLDCKSVKYMTSRGGEEMNVRY